jgi:hypothetical protein
MPIYLSEDAPISELPFPRPPFDAERAFAAIVKKAAELTRLRDEHADLKKETARARDAADMAAGELTALIRQFEQDRAEMLAPRIES